MHFHKQKYFFSLSKLLIAQQSWIDLMSAAAKNTKEQENSKLAEADQKITRIRDKILKKRTSGSDVKVQMVDSSNNGGSAPSSSSIKRNEPKKVCRNLFHIENETQLETESVDLTEDVPLKLVIVSPNKSPIRNYHSERDQLDMAIRTQQETTDAINKVSDKMDVLIRLQSQTVNQNEKIISLLDLIANAKND